MAGKGKSSRARKQSKKDKKGKEVSGATAKILDVKKPKPISISPPVLKKLDHPSKPNGADDCLTVKSGARPEVQTVIYVHGIGNKPKPSVLKCQWDMALFGVQLGDRSRMAYWVNREYYPRPTDDTCAVGDHVSIDDDEVTTRSIAALAAKRPMSESEVIEAEIESLTTNEAHRKRLQKVAMEMTGRGLFKDDVVDKKIREAGSVSARVLPLPPFLRRLITQKLTRAFLRDVNDFFYDDDRRAAMEESLRSRIDAGGGPFIIIAHSQGSMIAYNVLRQLKREECDVRLFLTIGSPLGLEEVKDFFRKWGGGKLPVPPCVDRWVNVAEWLDPVAADSRLADDFDPKERIKDYTGLLLIPDALLHPHSATGYLRSDPVQLEVRDKAGNAFAQAVGKTVIVKDLAEDLENGLRQERHTVLIQLANTATESQVSMKMVREALSTSIGEMLSEKGVDIKEAELDVLKRYVSARLTRNEIERIRTRFKELNIDKVWRDAQKKALINQSTSTIQARPANVGYNAMGEGIGWAVPDTGIKGDHPHFEKFKNIARQWDCTKAGAPKEVKDKESDNLDGNGHGTHVAGIISGQYEFMGRDGRPETVFSGMAPRAKLYGFKVLTDSGNGRDSYIIKALECIAELNEEAGKLIIHGVNLSLGGSFDPSVYGCGHTPLCQELRRLWNQGVLVCLAAGNEGYAILQSEAGEVPSNMDLSIGDPANLDEAIAVGSIHKLNPHTYGISFFSSRGPTADGRRKPDLVAPGEQILSAWHKFNRKVTKEKRKVEDL